MISVNYLLSNVIQMPCNLQGVSVTHIAMHSRKLFVNYLFGKPEGCIDQPRKQDKG